MTRNASGVPSRGDEHAQEKRTKRPYKIDPEVARERARKGGLARAAKLSEREHSEAMKQVRAARTAKDEAAGHTPKRRAGEPALPTEVLLFWKDVVRAEQPDREWKRPMELTRAAIRRLKQETDRITLEMRDQGRGAK